MSEKVPTAPQAVPVPPASTAAPTAPAAPAARPQLVQGFVYAPAEEEHDRARLVQPAAVAAAAPGAVMPGTHQPVHRFDAKAAHRAALEAARREQDALRRAHQQARIDAAREDEALRRGRVNARQADDEINRAIQRGQDALVDIDEYPIQHGRDEPSVTVAVPLEEGAAADEDPVKAKERALNEFEAKRREERGLASASAPPAATGGYQISEYRSVYDSGESTYTPGGYQISEYKSVYDQR